MRAFPLSVAAAFILLPLAAPVAVQAKTKGSEQIDFLGFQKLTNKVRPIRQKRLLTVEQFMAKAKETNAIILDARSERAFAAGHIDGAINVSFSDFTAKSLEQALGKDKNRPILIYCNNNFRDDRWPIVTKAAPVSLNIQTFVNLYAYGYKNVWEMGPDIVTSDARISWVGQHIAEPVYPTLIIGSSQSGTSR